MPPHLARGCHPTAKRPSPCQPPAFPSFPRAGGRASGCLRSGKRPGGQGQPFRQRLLPLITACCLASGLRPTRPALLCSAEAARRQAGCAQAHNPFRSGCARGVWNLAAGVACARCVAPFLEAHSYSQQTGQFQPRCRDNLGALWPLAPQFLWPVYNLFCANTPYTPSRRLTVRRLRVNTGNSCCEQWPTAGMGGL